MVINTLINIIFLLSLAIFSILIVLYLKVADAIDHYRLLELGLTDRSHENPPPPLQLIK